MSKPPLNYTTKIAVKQTLGECHDLLGDAGADAVATMYSGTPRRPTGLSFRLMTAHGPADFALPVNIEAVAKQLATATYPASFTGDARGRKQLAVIKSPEQAQRVAWRIVKDWLEAQLAIIAAGMVSLDEVMLPYLELRSGKTLREAWADGALAIESSRS